jgi:hypothetical protein
MIPGLIEISMETVLEIFPKFPFNGEEYDVEGVINRICTIHAYLASGHLRSLLCQSTAKKLFKRTSFISAHAPYSITARVYTLVDLKQPAWTDKSTKKGKLPMEHTALGELTETPIHAWLRVRPNT